MNTSLPMVTMVGLCYNQSRYIIESLESIRQQTYPNMQVILVDDCSKDDSVSVVESWLVEHQLNWIFIRHKENRGITRSLNETLELAKGKYYKAIACDDIILPQFISTMVDCFEQLPENFALIYSDVVTMDENSNDFGTTPFKERGWDVEEKVPSGSLFDMLAAWCFIPALGTFMRTSVLKKIKFDESLLIEDWDMWLQISKKYSIKGILPAMGRYRIHSASMYQKKSPAYRDHELRTMEKHLGYSKVADVKIKEFIYKNSILLYMHNGNRPLHWLWQRFQIKKTIENFMHVLLAIFYIDYEQKEKWKKRLTRAS
jgi:glycosyltransferase involved in cell wall biosynthesis